MNKLIIDTDILIDYARGDKKALELISGTEYSLLISRMTEFELLVGARSKKELKLIEEFVNSFHIIDFSPEISMIALNLLKNFRLSHGLLIGDALIAATALFSQCDFITKNQKHYRFIKNLKLIEY